MTSLDFEPSSVREGRNDLTCGVAIGCEDGTFYILRSGPIARGRPEGTQGPTQPTGTSISLQISGSHRPRSSSPSAGSGFAPFHVTRSRIVSSVSTELAEAPKNYVDFDDEEERLKEMLKGRAMKERSTGGIAEKAAVAEKSPSQVPSSSASSTHTRDNSRAFRSIVVSPASSIRSLSSPPSPTLLPNHEPQDPFDSPVLSLQCHVLPPRFGAGQAITALKSHDDGRFLLCLQRTG
ncbi:hypothetical protein A0H81_08463 [Grifola frondosa]|uniref:Uncharacterized protein n=1 Tax=Grifola frondosa TaxID=5627 RepID=A0A1C7M2U1_GRIFR|nr:hypothetical protein A0H81_08463 [Grifola frondosa]